MTKSEIQRKEETKENAVTGAGKDYSKAVFTIPNLLSMFRLVLIPIIAASYLYRVHPLVTVGLLLLSGLTDIVDGWIARKFHMTSDLGKALDPVADKLTQFTMLLCLALTNRPIRVLLICMAVKEFIMGLEGILVVKATGTTYSARWHGKANTCLLHATLLIHLLWFNMPESVTVLLVCLCLCMMLLSFVLYTLDNVGRIRQAGKKSDAEPTSKS